MAASRAALSPDGVHRRNDLTVQARPLHLRVSTTPGAVGHVAAGSPLCCARIGRHQAETGDLGGARRRCTSEGWKPWYKKRPVRNTAMLASGPPGGIDLAECLVM